MTSEIVPLGQAGSTIILAAQLPNVIFVLREEFAFIMYQTFSRNDPPGKAPPSRGRSVSKREKRGGKKRDFRNRTNYSLLVFNSLVLILRVIRRVSSSLHRIACEVELCIRFELAEVSCMHNNGQR